MTISITSPTSTTSKIQQNGNDVLTVDSSNNVTVTNNLSVSGTVSSTGAITFNGGTVTGDFVVDTNTLYVNATNNRVGIGTSSPAQKLQVSSTGDNVILSSGGSGAAGYIAANSNGRTNLTGAFILLQYSNGTAELNNSSNSNMIFKTNSTERMRITNGGELWLGTTSRAFNSTNYGITIPPNGETFWVTDTPGNIIAFNRNSDGLVFKFFRSGGQVGAVSVTSTNTIYSTSSDYRLKENVVPMSGSIDRIKQLKPSTWSWTQDGSHGEGFLAHEAQTVVPEAVTGTKDAMKTEEYEVTPAVLDDDGNVVTEAVMGTREVPDYQGIDQAKLVPLLTAALQEAITKIEDLETRIEALESN